MGAIDLAGEDPIAPNEGTAACWSGHVKSWHEQTDVPVHAVRYEDLRTNPEREFAAALAFVGCPTTMEEITRVVGRTGFAELQRQERENGFREHKSLTSFFFRSGRTGAWRKVLTVDQVGSIEAAHRPIMEKLGYQPFSQERKA